MAAAGVEGTACFVNHRTTDDDVLELVSEVIAAAAELND